MKTVPVPAFDDDRAEYLREAARDLLSTSNLDEVIEDLCELAMHRTEFECFMQNMWTENLQHRKPEHLMLGFWLAGTDLIPTGVKEEIFDDYWPPDLDTLASLSLLKQMEQEEMRRLLVDVLVSVRREAMSRSDSSE